MANVKVSALSALTAPADADVLLIVDDSEASVEKSKKVTAAALKAYNMVGGYLQRAIFTWKDADEIYVGAGCYEVAGKIALWSSQLTKQLSGPTASTWYYLYLDESAITSLTAITATELIWSTTAPSWSHTYRGWYNSADRCIFAVRSNASSQIAEFYQQGDDVIFADDITNRAMANLSTSWTDVTLTIPAFTQCGLCTINTYYNGSLGANYCYWRTNGQTGATGHLVCYVGNNIVRSTNSLQVYTDSSQIIEVKMTAAGNYQAEVLTYGHKLPSGL